MSTACHSFDVEIASTRGVDAAILIHHLAFWIKKNQANEKHLYEGRHWTYNSARAFAELFPYWDSRKVSRILKQLEADGLVKSGNFNELKMDRTKWYTIVCESICRKYSLHWTNIDNANTGSVQPIPDINTDINTDSNSPCNPPGDPFALPASKPKADSQFDNFWMIYPRKTGSKPAARKTWIKKKLDAKADIIIANVQDRMEREWDIGDRQYIPHPSTFLSQDRWETDIIDRKESNAALPSTGKQGEGGYGLHDD